MATVHGRGESGYRGVVLRICSEICLARRKASWRCGIAAAAGEVLQTWRG